MMNTNQDTTTKANSQPVNANMSTIEIGTRVRCGEGFAYAFKGQISLERQALLDKAVAAGRQRNYTLMEAYKKVADELKTRVDTATPAAAGWNPIETLAAQAHIATR